VDTAGTPLVGEDYDILALGRVSRAVMGELSPSAFTKVMVTTSFPELVSVSVSQK
jgi:hypothetical protein